MNQLLVSRQRSEFVDKPVSARDVATGIVRRFTQAWSILELSLSVSRQRRQLAGLSNEALKDLGLTRSDAHREARRHFWDVPEVQWRSQGFL